MGAGASAMKAVPDDLKEKAVQALQVSDNKTWLDVHDITTLDEGRKELCRLRNLAAETCLPPAQQGKNRQAVMAKEKVDTSPPKSVPKDDKISKMIRMVMKDNILFKHIQEKEAETTDLILAFEKVEYTKGDVIITQGEKGEKFYVIESGKIGIQVNGKEVGVISSGKAFGELALMYNTPRAATCFAQGPATLWQIDRSDFRKILHLHAEARSKKYGEFLAKVTFSDGAVKKTFAELLSPGALENLGKALEEKVYKKGEIIIRQGETGDYFYIIESGTVEVHVDPKLAKGKVAKDMKPATKVADLEAGGYFGEKALMQDDVRAASIMAQNEVKCLELGRDDFVSMLGDVKDLMAGGGGSEESAVDTPPSARKSEKITMDDLQPGKTLGHGAFGRVKLCKNKGNGDVYALKCQAKKAIVENSLQEHILMEATILLQLDHPFILKLVAALQDDTYVYFVLEILLGGELFAWLRNIGRFEEKPAKFFTASVVLAFQHMHAKKIAYRDLKPENLVLDEKGYLKVVDLGLAKIVEGKTWTLCGTPDYLAPEIILNEGHDKAVDYWALGVLIYELVAGMPPFYADDPMEVYEKILSSNLTIPQHFSKNLSDIVRKLLKLCQSKRIGNGKGGCGAIAKHKWFSGFDWDGLLGYAMASPITVKVKSKDDTSNFDDYGDEAETAEDTDWSPDLDSI